MVFNWQVNKSNLSKLYKWLRAEEKLLLGRWFLSLRFVCCLYPCFVQIVSTPVELRTTWPSSMHMWPCLVKNTCNCMVMWTTMTPSANRSSRFNKQNKSSELAVLTLFSRFLCNRCITYTNQNGNVMVALISKIAVLSRVIIATSISQGMAIDPLKYMGKWIVLSIGKRFT